LFIFPAVASDGRVFVCGGANSKQQVIPQVECLDTNLKSWEVVACLTRPRINTCCACLCVPIGYHQENADQGEALFVFGGNDGALLVPTIERLILGKPTAAAGWRNPIQQIRKFAMRRQSGLCDSLGNLPIAVMESSIVCFSNVS
jgi:hypothetical protein